MNLRRVKHMLLRLSSEQKIAGIGSIIVLASAFLPWYSVMFNFNEKGITESGFSGDLGVIGFVIFLLTSLGLTFLMSDHLHIKLPRFGMKKENITMFLMGESAFLALLTVAVYTKRSLEYTNAELRFGLYLALIGSVLAAFAQYAEMQKSQTKDVQAFFGQEEAEVYTKSKDKFTEQELISDEYINEEPAEDAEFIEDEEMSEPSKKSETNELFEEESIEPEQEIPFPEADEEDEELYNASEDSENQQNEEITAENIEQTEGADPIIEDLSETIKAPIDIEENENNMPESENINQNNQGSYFTKEAGIAPKPNIKVDIESIKSIEKSEEESKKTVQQNMSFYDDL